MKIRTNADVMRKALRHLRKQPYDFAGLIRQHPQCPLHRGRSDLFQTLISSIVGQQLSVTAAATIRGRLSGACGRGGIDAISIAGLADTECRAIGLSAAKARFIRGLADAQLAGELNFRQLAQLPDETVIAHLTNFPGVGVWTAQMFLMFGLRRPDVAAPADVGLQRGMQMLCKLDERPDPATFETISAPWRPYRSIASWYLWRLAG